MKLAAGTTLLMQGSPHCLGDELGGCSKTIVDAGAANDTAPLRHEPCDEVCDSNIMFVLHIILDCP